MQRKTRAKQPLDVSLFSASAAKLFPPLQHLQKDAREFTEKLAKFVTFSSRIFEREELNAWSQIATWQASTGRGYLTFFSKSERQARPQAK